MNNKTSDPATTGVKNQALASVRGVIFDCDGVLVDSRSANNSFYNQVRFALDLPRLSEADEEYAHMSTYMQALEYIIPPELRHRMDEAVQTAWLNADYHSLLTAEDGVLELLDWLRSAGVRLALCTNRVEPLGDFLARYGMADYFDPVQSASNSVPKPSPDGLLQILDKWGMPPEQVAFVGDSQADEAAARAAGVPLWAFKNPSLEASLHVRSFPSLLELFRTAR